MRSSKKLTVSAISVALGVVFMALGAVFSSLDLTVVCLASLLVTFVYIEVGAPYTYLVWICTTLLAALFYPASLMWSAYLLVFGIWPILKGAVEKLRHALWLLVKLAYGTLSLSLLFVIEAFVLGIPMESLFGLPMEVSAVILVLVSVIAFMFYDVFLTVGVRTYYQKIRPKIKNLLK